MNEITNALKYTTDTKACIIARGAIRSSFALISELFPGVKKVFLVADPNTWRVAGEAVAASLKANGVEVKQFMLGADGAPFHAEYKWIDVLREAYLREDGRPKIVAVGSGTINDLCKRMAEEVGERYVVIGTAASMDGYTSFGAAITKDGMKQTLSCKAPLGCLIDTEIAAAAPKEMAASGYADLIAKLPAGADWMIADVIDSEKIHPQAWDFVQKSLRKSLSNPAGVAAGDVDEIAGLCKGLIMSGFAMQAMGSSRPASGTEHQISHYWDMEDLCFEGRPVSHGFKVGIGTLVSTILLEFLLEEDLSTLDVDATVAQWWPSFEVLKAEFPKVFGSREAHIRRAESEMLSKYPTPEQLRIELLKIKEAWSELAPKLRAQLMTYSEVRECLRIVGAPYSIAQIGVTPERFLETLRGISYMRNRYFGMDLLCRIGKYEQFEARLKELMLPE
jgi:glycerol-1-phosphate dehydrogenase [NAD(P)+]